MNDLYPDGTKVVISKRLLDQHPHLKEFYVGILIVKNGLVKRNVNYSGYGNQLKATHHNFELANPIWLSVKDK